MKRRTSSILLSLISLAIISEIEGYSKYGRTCSDIGCLNNEVCVMQEEPCTYSRTECGRYPTCQRATQLSCSNIECPRGQECVSETGSAKCVNTRSGASAVSQSNSNSPAGPPPVPNAPYPNDGTTSRPRPAYPSNGGSGYIGGAPGSGYPGGAVGSGYPGQQPAAGGYPQGYPSPPQQRPAGYPAYPSNGYAGYPNNGYPSYPSQGGGNGYPSNGYPAGYPAYPSNANTQYAQPYPQQPPKSQAPSFTDQLTQGLKLFAGNYVRDQVTKAIQKQLSQH